MKTFLAAFKIQDQTFLRTVKAESLDNAKTQCLHLYPQIEDIRLSEDISCLPVLCMTKEIEAE